MTLDDLEYNENGAPVGEFRVFHRDPTFAGELGPIPFAEGQSAEPVSAVWLRRLVVACGDDVEYVEPWAADADDDGEVSRPGDDLDAMDRDDLRAFAREHGVRFPGQPSAETMRARLRERFGL